MKVGIINTFPIRIPVLRPGCGYYLRWYYNGWHYWQFLPGKELLLTEGEKYRTLGTRKITMSSGLITYVQNQAIRTILNSREVYILTDYGWKSLRIEPSQIPVYNNLINGYEIELSAIIGSRDLSVTGFSPVIITPIVPPNTSYCDLDIIIAGQIWMCKNWDSSWPGSKVYDNDEVNRSIYGGLYTRDQIMSPGFVPAGYHIPTLAEWVTLINALGGGTVAGGELKEVGTTHWLSPNTGALDSQSFAALGTGFFNTGVGLFSGLKELTYFWTTELFGGTTPEVIQLNYDNDDAQYVLVSATNYLPIRFIKDDLLYFGYGSLYNWYAVDLGILAPLGCHVIDYAEWQSINTYLGVTAGGKMKITGTIFWNSPNTGATNEAGTYILGAGLRITDGTFANRGSETQIWTPDISGAFGKMIYFVNNSAGLGLGLNSKSLGMSVRVAKDSTLLSEGETGRIVDIDGNIYPSVVVNGIEMASSSLKVTRYNDGTPIPEVTDNAAWAALATGARCWYNNTPE